MCPVLDNVKLYLKLSAWYMLQEGVVETLKGCGSFVLVKVEHGHQEVREQPRSLLAPVVLIHLIVKSRMKTKLSSK